MTNPNGPQKVMTNPNFDSNLIGFTLMVQYSYQRYVFFCYQSRKVTKQDSSPGFDVDDRETVVHFRTEVVQSRDDVELKIYFGS